MLYRFFAKIPIFSTIVKIVNSYVYDGDICAMDKFAPLRSWLKAIGLPLLVAAMITGGLLHNSISFPHWSEYLFDINGSISATLDRIHPNFIAISVSKSFGFRNRCLCTCFCIVTKNTAFFERACE